MFCKSNFREVKNAKIRVNINIKSGGIILYQSGPYQIYCQVARLQMKEEISYGKYVSELFVIHSTKSAFLANSKKFNKDLYKITELYFCHRKQNIGLFWFL